MGIEMYIWVENKEISILLNLKTKGRWINACRLHHLCKRVRAGYQIRRIRFRYPGHISGDYAQPTDNAHNAAQNYTLVDYITNIDFNITWISGLLMQQIKFYSNHIYTNMIRPSERAINWAQVAPSSCANVSFAWQLMTITHDSSTDKCCQQPCRKRLAALIPVENYNDDRCEIIWTSHLLFFQTDVINIDLFIVVCVWFRFNTSFQ